MKLYDQFRAYHEANPRVYRLVKRFAYEVIQRGYPRYGIAPIWERVRWSVQIDTGDFDFKMPNNHRAYYARLWLDDHPQYRGFFETNALRSGEQWKPVGREHGISQSL